MAAVIYRGCVTFGTDRVNIIQQPVFVQKSVGSEIVCRIRKTYDLVFVIDRRSVAGVPTQRPQILKVATHVKERGLLAGSRSKEFANDMVAVVDPVSQAREVRWV